MANRFVPDAELSRVTTKLWNLDVNSCVPGTDYQIDLQGNLTSTRNTRLDLARDKLFTRVDEARVFQRPTYKAFRALLDNYESETGRPEQVTQQKIRENWTFINLIMDTPVMQECHHYLASKGKADQDVDTFKNELYNMWFKLYTRKWEDSHLNSSGFEHVFVGETRNHSVIGFHNWIQFYLQEKRGNVNYHGYFCRCMSDGKSPRVITIQFEWAKSTVKPIGSSFIGTSPEFEIALYTLLHCMNRGDRVPLCIAGYELEVCCFPHGRHSIGAAYPVCN